MKQNPIKIFVTDDHPVVRDGLIALLETQADFEIVGAADGGEETIAKLSELKVDILFLDLGLPGMNGVEVINKLKAFKNKVNIIVFTVYDTDDRIIAAIKAGAKGYLLKGASREEIYQAVRVVHSGQSLIQPVIASKLFNHLSHSQEKLSLRELDVLHWVVKGFTNQEIAEKLFITERTVKFHVSSILSKLGAQNRTEAVQIAVKKGVIRM